LDRRLEFILLEVKEGDQLITQYINRNHIVRIYLVDDDIYVELTNQQTLNVSYTNIKILMECFIQL
jgi:hypothetical protein